jgi:hypothetical protein
VHESDKTTDKHTIYNALREDGPGSNYHTIDPGPISFFHDDRVDVEMYPSGWGQYGVQVTCDELGYDSGLRLFADEEQSELWARNQYSSLISKLGAANDIVEKVIKRILKDVI